MKRFTVPPPLETLSAYLMHGGYETVAAGLTVMTNRGEMRINERCEEVTRCLVGLRGLKNIQIHKQ